MRVIKYTTRLRVLTGRVIIGAMSIPLKVEPGLTYKPLANVIIRRNIRKTIIANIANILNYKNVNIVKNNRQCNYKRMLV